MLTKSPDGAILHHHIRNEFVVYINGQIVNPVILQSGMNDSFFTYGDDNTGESIGIFFLKTDVGSVFEFSFCW